jgi:preprotein translocase subunit SecA
VANLFEKILRAGDKKTLKRLKGLTEQINTLEDAYKELSDEEVRGLTDEFKERLAEGEDLDSLLPEAFAAVREASRRPPPRQHRRDEDR